MTTNRTQLGDLPRAFTYDPTTGLPNGLSDLIDVQGGSAIGLHSRIFFSDLGASTTTTRAGFVNDVFEEDSGLSIAIVASTRRVTITATTTAAQTWLADAITTTASLDNDGHLVRWVFFQRPDVRGELIVVGIDSRVSVTTDSVTGAHVITTDADTDPADPRLVLMESYQANETAPTLGAPFTANTNVRGYELINVQPAASLAVGEISPAYLSTIEVADLSGSGNNDRRLTVTGLWTNDVGLRASITSAGEVTIRIDSPDGAAFVNDIRDGSGEVRNNNGDLEDWFALSRPGFNELIFCYTDTNTELLGVDDTFTAVAVSRRSNHPDDPQEIGTGTGDFRGFTETQVHAFELGSISIRTLSDTPDAYGTSGQVLVVNDNGDGLAWSDVADHQIIELATGDVWPTGATTVLERDYVLFTNGDLALRTAASTLTVVAGTSTDIPTSDSAGWKFVFNSVTDGFIDQVRKNGSNYDLSANVRVHPTNIESLQTTRSSGNVSFTFLGINDERGQGEAGAPLVETLSGTSGTNIEYRSGYIDFAADINTAVADIQDIASVHLRFPTADGGIDIGGNLDLNNRGPVSARFTLEETITPNADIQLVVNYFYRQAVDETITLSGITLTDVHTGRLYQPAIDLIRDHQPDTSAFTADLNELNRKLTEAEDDIDTLQTLTSTTRIVEVTEHVDVNFEGSPDGTTYSAPATSFTVGDAGIYFFRVAVADLYLRPDTTAPRLIDFYVNGRRHLYQCSCYQWK